MSREARCERRPSRGRAGLTVLAAAVVLAIWVLGVRPWVLVASAYSLTGEDTPEQTQLARRAVACGPSGLSATLWAAETRFGSDGRFAWTPLALRGIGEPARKELVARVGRTAEPTKRHHLIYLLQVAFEDYRFLKDWIRDAPPENSMDGRHLAVELTRICGEPPPRPGSNEFQATLFDQYLKDCSSKLNVSATDAARGKP